MTGSGRQELEELPSLRTLSIHHELYGLLDISRCANLVSLDLNSCKVRL